MNKKQKIEDLTDEFTELSMQDTFEQVKDIFKEHYTSKYYDCNILLERVRTIEK
jgi:hypothetical protein